MKITEESRPCEKNARGIRGNDSQVGSADQRRGMAINWAESEFFQVWLRLAREGKQRNQN
jgi:hypothetical protein